MNRVRQDLYYSNRPTYFFKVLILNEIIPRAGSASPPRARTLVDPFRPEATSPGTTPTGDPGLVSAHSAGLVRPKGEFWFRPV
jgi:hypothetical protein